MLAVLAALACLPSHACAQADRGKLLYENHCLGCHTSRVHIRERREVRDVGQLRVWIARWSNYLGLEWTQEDRVAVELHLSETYYQLEAGQ